MTSIDCDEMTKFFYIIYDILISTKDQNKFACNFNALLKSFPFGNFKNILNIKMLILNLKNEFPFAYKLCLYSYIRCDLFHKLANIYGFDFDSTENEVFELIVEKLYAIKNDISYINAFRFFSYKKEFANELGVLSNNDKTKVLWEFEMRNEMIRSLVLIVEYFKLDALKSMNVKLIKYSETLDMSFKELSKYYNKQIILISKSLKTRKYYCDSFVELEQSFIDALLTNDDKIHFDDFEIVVKMEPDCEFELIL